MKPIAYSSPCERHRATTRHAGLAVVAALFSLTALSIGQGLTAAPLPQGGSLGKTFEPRAPVAVAPKGAVTETKTFALAAGERTSWGLVVGEPGTIEAVVRANGTPVVVRLTRPNGTSVEQTGSGEVRLQVPVSATDTGSGQLWLLGVRTAAAAPAAPAPVTDRAIRLEARIAAQGTVTVSHPPGDNARAQAELQSRAQRMQQLSAAQQSAVVDRELKIAIDQTNAQQAQRQNAMIEQLRASLASGQSLQKATAGAPRPSPSQIGTSPTRLQGSTLPMTGMSSTGSVAPVGSQGSPATAAIAAAITSLSVGRGVPGDPVLINGTGFGTQGGTVRIAIAPGQSLVAPVVVWSDKSILARVPDASGIAAPYRGQLSVERSGSAPASAAFEFVPAVETRILAPQLGQFSVAGPGGVSTNVCHPACAYGVDLGNLLFGHKGEDVFFNNVTLLNGWHVKQIGLGHVSGQAFSFGVWTDNSADAQMVETRVGTNSPYLRVGWWHDAFSSVAYWPRVVIEGPKGVPHL